MYAAGHFTKPDWCQSSRSPFPAIPNPFPWLWFRHFVDGKVRIALIYPCASLIASGDINETWMLLSKQDKHNQKLLSRELHYATSHLHIAEATCNHMTCGFTICWQQIQVSYNTTAICNIIQITVDTAPNLRLCSTAPLMLQSSFPSQWCQWHAQSQSIHQRVQGLPHIGNLLNSIFDGPLFNSLSVMPMAG